MQIIDLNSTNANENPLASMAKVEKEKLIPAHYAKIQLSTEGKVGAPAEYHVRNFSTRDIMDLALSEEQDLPERLLNLLQGLIFEDDVRVADFHEAEIVEHMVRMYATFFSPTIEIDFPVEKEDYEALERLDPAGYRDKVNALKTGKWTPKVTIDLRTDIDTYKLDAAFQPVVTCVNKKSGFSVAFGLPKYGDIITIKKWLAENFDEKEKKFAAFKQTIDLYNNLLERFEAGENIDLNRLPLVDPDIEKEYKNFQLAKAAALVDVIRALHLISFEGKDVSKEPLSTRIALVQDPRVDASIAKKIDSYFEKMPFGIKPDVRMINPITGEPCIRRYSFRLADILQAIQLSESNEYDIVFGNEYKPNPNGN